MANTHPIGVPTQNVPPVRSTVPMDCKKSTKKFVSTTMSNDAPQLIFLSGVHLEVLVSRFI
jgi:hypothetical protein